MPTMNPHRSASRWPTATRWSLLLTLFAAWAVPTLAVSGADGDNPVIEVELLGEPYRLEVVDTPERRGVGLMHRRALEPGHGMFFWYPRTGDHRIWMKNTLIPLTVVWLDEEARILDAALLTPCGEGDCPGFGAGNDTRYVLELPAQDLPRFAPGKRLPALLEYRPTRQAPGE